MNNNKKPTTHYSLHLDAKAVHRGITAAIVAIVVGVPGLLIASQVASLNVFVSGNVISAEDVNENFEALRLAVNDTDSRIGAVGYVLIGDVASGISTAVSGDISFASKSNSGSSSTITINYPDQGNNNFVAMVTVTSYGTADDDNDLETPVILNQTSSSLDIFLNETNGTYQDLRLNVVLMHF